MFAKIFSQILDSSIAQCADTRRMFQDLLILADPTGAVDMTHDAIARRLNVPIEQVRRDMSELLLPDAESRSKKSDGRRIVPLDPNREWGWKIVNYEHYRQIRDQEALRSYFRDYQRKRRGKTKSVKDTNLTALNSVEIPSSTSSSKSSSVKKGDARGKGQCTEAEAVQFAVSLGLPASDGTAMVLHWQERKWPKDWKLTIRKWKSFGYLPSQKGGRNGANQKPVGLSVVNAASTNRNAAGQY